MKREGYAFFAAAAFLTHPINSEGVIYISSRSELLSALFFLIGFLIFMNWRKERGLLCATAVGIPYVLAILSKETTVTLPAILFLYDFLFLSGASFREILKRRRFYSVFLVVGMAVSLWIGIVGLRGAIGPSLPGHLSVYSYALTQTRVIAHYWRLVFWPTNLNLDYDLTPSVGLGWPEVWFIGLHLSALMVGWAMRRKLPLLSFGIFWLYLTLAPTSSVVPILDTIFEHRLYLPMAGVALAFPVIISGLQRAEPRGGAE